MKPLNFQTFRFGAVDSSFGVLQVPMVLNQLPQARVFDAFLRSLLMSGCPFCRPRMHYDKVQLYLRVTSGLLHCRDVIEILSAIEKILTHPHTFVPKWNRWKSCLGRFGSVERELARIISKGMLLFLGQITSNHVFFNACTIFLGTQSSRNNGYSRKLLLV
jgi:hypothetical protein